MSRGPHGRFMDGDGGDTETALWSAIEQQEAITPALVDELVKRFADDRDSREALERENRLLRIRIQQLEAEHESRRDAKLDLALNILTHIKGSVEEREQIIIVKEMSFDEATGKLKEEVLPKYAEIGPLDIAEELNICYDLAHELYLALLEEGILRFD